MCMVGSQRTTKKGTSALLDGCPRTTTITYVHREFVSAAIKQASSKKSNWTAYGTLLFKEQMMPHSEVHEGR